MSASGTGFVALLRGVNVGRANRVTMAQLRELLESLGYSGVRTLLNSGNAVCGAARQARAGGDDTQLGDGHEDRCAAAPVDARSACPVSATARPVTALLS
jgi:hypothetical protein